MTGGGGDTSQHHEPRRDSNQNILDDVGPRPVGIEAIPGFHPAAESAIDAKISIARLARYFAGDRVAATLYFAQSMARRFDSDRIGDRCICCEKALAGTGSIVGVGWLVTPPAASFMLTMAPMPQVPLITHHLFCETCAAAWLQKVRAVVGLATGLRWLGWIGWVALLGCLALVDRVPRWSGVLMLISGAAVLFGTFGGNGLRVVWWLVTPRPLRKIRRYGMRILGVAGTTTVEKLATMRASTAAVAPSGTDDADASETSTSSASVADDSVLEYAKPDADDVPLGVPEFYHAAERAIEAGARPWDMRRLFRDPDDAAQYFALSASRRYARDCCGEVCASCAAPGATRVAQVGWVAAAVAPSWVLTNGRQPVEWSFITHHALCATCASVWERREARFGRAIRISRIALAVSLTAGVLALGVRMVPSLGFARSLPAAAIVLGILVVLLLGWLSNRIIRYVWQKTLPRPLAALRRGSVRVSMVIGTENHKGETLGVGPCVDFHQRHSPESR